MNNDSSRPTNIYTQDHLLLLLAFQKNVITKADSK